MNISLCMIVKNEEKTLGRCLDSVRDFVDEIIIVDTGSSDETKKTALKYTDKIYDFEWADDFSKARNYSFSKAAMEYIMWLDADDVLLEEDREKFKKLKRDFDPAFDVVMMKYIVGGNEGGLPPCVFMRERLLKRSKGFTWHDPIHEYILLDGKILDTDICVTHMSLHKRSDRNLKIFEKMITEGKKLSDRNLFYYARELFINRRFAEAIEYYNRFLDTRGGLPSNYMDASMDLAGCYRFLNDDKNVLKALLRSFEHDPPRAEICCQIGFFYKQKRDFSSAIFWYDLASKIKKPSGTWGSVINDYYDFIPNAELSVCYFKTGNLEKAIYYNDVASGFKPEDETVKQNAVYFNSLKKGSADRDKIRVLIGSPVYQKPPILAAFLESLGRLSKETVSLDFIFVDDNAEEESGKLLRKFCSETGNAVILEGEKQKSYVCDDVTHRWNSNLVLKVLKFKNVIIERALSGNYDYLFLIDSDILVHPKLIEHLISLRKDIVSEVFFTKFRPEEIAAPNVWMFDQYDLAPRDFGESLSEEERLRRTHQFINMLKTPGVYEVGGLGACTLISRDALIKGVNFSPIKNLTMPGEDRYFCIRAAVLGIGLFADTHYPAYHIYRDEQLSGAADYVKSCAMPLSFLRRYKERGNKLTLSMIVRNESGRYLTEVLAKLRGVIDEAVIIDDCSFDDTAEICENMLTGIKKHIIHNEAPMFGNEIDLRKKQWEETLKLNPDWILSIDADEIFEDAFYKNVKNMINQKDHDVILFRLYDMWDEKHFREDKYWEAHRSFRPFLLRFQPDFPYEWHETPLHCGRFPANILMLPAFASKFRVKHYGWAKAEDRRKKYENYKELDPDAIYGDRNQYESILDENPKLLEWTE